MRQGQHPLVVGKICYYAEGEFAISTISPNRTHRQNLPIGLVLARSCLLNERYTDRYTPSDRLGFFRKPAAIRPLL